MRGLVAIPALGLVGLVLFEFFVSFLLPQRVKREARFARTILVGLWRGWRFGARRLRSRDTWLGFFGPIGLLTMLATWVSGLIVAFAALDWAASAHLAASGGRGVGDYLYYSAGTFFSAATDLHAPAGVARAIEIAEAVCGYLVLFGVIGYLPTLFQSYSRREVAVSQLDPRAGSPPSAGTLLYRSARRGGWADLDDYLAEWEGWAAELMETHLSYPLLAFYRSQHVNQNWLAALVTVVDTSAFAIAVAPERTPAAEITFAIGRHALADLTYSFRAKRAAGDGERLDAAAFERLRTKLGEAGLDVAEPEDSRAKLAELRELYEPYAAALSRRLELPLPVWVRETRTENWRVAAWRERHAPAQLH